MRKWVIHGVRFTGFYNAYIFIERKEMEIGKCIYFYRADRADDKDSIKKFLYTKIHKYEQHIVETSTNSKSITSALHTWYIPWSSSRNHQSTESLPIFFLLKAIWFRQPYIINFHKERNDKSKNTIMVFRFYTCSTLAISQLIPSTCNEYLRRHF